MAIEPMQGIQGYVSQDVEILTFKSGATKTKIPLGVSTPGEQQADGTWSEGPTEYVDVVMWGEAGAKAAESYRKGDKLLAVGRMVEREFEGRDGQLRQVQEFRASFIGPNANYHKVEIARRTPAAPSVQQEAPTAQQAAPAAAQEAEPEWVDPALEPNPPAHVVVAQAQHVDMDGTVTKEHTIAVPVYDRNREEIVKQAQSMAQYSAEFAPPPRPGDSGLGI